MNLDPFQILILSISHDDIIHKFHMRMVDPQIDLLSPLDLFLVQLTDLNHVNAELILF